MHFNASRSLTQPLLDCIQHNVSMIQALYPALQVYPWESVSEFQSIKETTNCKQTGA